MRAAFERAVHEEAAKGVADTLTTVASDPNHPHYAQAVNLLSKILGLTDAEAQRVVLQTVVELKDRRETDEPARVMFASTAESAPPAVQGDGESVEVQP